MIKIGYHYTSLKCTESIKLDGIIPYDISKDTKNPDVLAKIQTKGIWVWQRKLTPIEHAASLIFQALSKMKLQLALVIFKYSYPEDIYHVNNRELIIDHYYDTHPDWHNDVPAYIVTKIIKPKAIIEIKEYDLPTLLYNI